MWSKNQDFPRGFVTQYELQHKIVQTDCPEAMVTQPLAALFLYTFKLRSTVFGSILNRPKLERFWLGTWMAV
ncbi:hypothetical protein GTQ43_27520 [Nostoc sp. KVJ3]|uniref:hypothetical protein n=1 Tax=Nostoc sp. KVJ3 TaxID=457945 RepID=UPI0022372FDA|nr:hypothetical protein [Nostoc sp. KVJ3]MCW5317421.1 hypothetical protein [Nostoc sp. KVJ3]